MLRQYMDLWMRAIKGADALAVRLGIVPNPQARINRNSLSKTSTGRRQAFFHSSRVLSERTQEALVWELKRRAPQRHHASPPAVVPSCASVRSTRTVECRGVWAWSARRLCWFTSTEHTGCAVAPQETGAAGGDQGQRMHTKQICIIHCADKKA